jgi:hypothetical protein
MYQQNTILDLERVRMAQGANQRRSAQTAGLSVVGPSRSLRHTAGDALISLGQWIKPRQSRNFNIRSAGLAGR